MKFFISLIITLSGSLAQGDFYNNHAQGWFWYQDPKMCEPEEESSATLPPTPPPTVPQKPVHAETQQLETFKETLKQTLNTALVNPTHENVERYMTVQKEMLNRSETFAQTWQQVVLTNPALNHEVVYPTAQFARHAHHDQQRQQKESLIQSLSHEFGLFYFFKSNCGYCTSFSSVVKLFSEKYEWDVLAVSLDGSQHDLFKTVTNNGMAEMLNITGVPALMAFNPQTGQLIPISYAATSLDQLEENIITLVGEKR